VSLVARAAAAEGEQRIRYRGTELVRRVTAGTPVVLKADDFATA
jgi:hypothetical protein